jgi:hypothetical protein
MKVAICFSGELRDMEKSVSYWKPIIDKYSMDVYGSFWSSSEKNIGLFENLCPVKMEIENPEAFLPYLDLLREELRVPTAPEINYGVHIETAEVNRSATWASMWYKVWRSQMLTVGRDYDVIIRARTDCYFDRLFEEIELEVKEGLCIPWGWIYNSAWKNCGGPVDMFAYGGRKEMDIYSSLFLYLSRYLSLGSYSFPAENLLKVHLSSFPLLIHYIPTKINLFRRSENSFNWADGVTEWTARKSDFPSEIDDFYSFYVPRLRV